jgi:hypothetical protein
MKKVKKFFSQNNPYEAGTINKGNSNILLDWVRLCGEDAVINDIKVADYKETYANFNNKNSLETFFSSVILENFKVNNDKQKAVDYLMTTFHQGGLMYPVSAALPIFLFEKLGAQPQGGVRQIRITPTQNGFKIQEIYTAKKIAFVIEDKMTPQLKKLSPVKELPLMEDENYLIKAGASVDVDFSADAANPKVTVESNYISFGNSTLASALNQRSLGQIIVDFFRNMLGYNVVEIMDNDEALPNQARLNPM